MYVGYPCWLYRNLFLQRYCSHHWTDMQILYAYVQDSVIIVLSFVVSYLYLADSYAQIAI